jgi:hypothetical protein
MRRRSRFKRAAAWSVLPVLVDDDPNSTNDVPGLFGLQIEGTPSKVSFRNLWLRKID